MTSTATMTAYEQEYEKYHNPTWVKLECDRGCRWTAVKGGFCDDNKEGSPCFFSGCQPGHSVHVRGETKDGDEAHDWFRNPGREALTH